MTQSSTVPSVYADLVHLFIELRGRGLSLSSHDLEYVRVWQKKGISAELVANVMLDMAEQCKKEGKVFPNSFSPVARRVETFLKRRAEF